jgi:hypothetical protein
MDHRVTNGDSSTHRLLDSNQNVGDVEKGQVQSKETPEELVLKKKQNRRMLICSILSMMISIPSLVGA